MRRIIFVPQYPTPLRYQEWWFWKIPEKFRKAGFEVVVLGEEWVKTFGNLSSDPAMFSPIDMAIAFETEQINEYMQMQFEEDDMMFIADISFPGFFSNVLFHKRPPGRVFAYCHATSLNKMDYFEHDRVDKFPIETSHAHLMDAVFVGSDYHENKLQWPNTLVMRLPYPPLKTYNGARINDIISASRPTPQKVDSILEMKVEKKFSKIIRQESRSWEEYFKFLSVSKVLLVSSREDTFGYQIVDAVLNGCIPIAPNRCAYPEILPKEYLYNNDEELFELLNSALWGTLDVPKLKCHNEMKDFYKNLIEVVGG